jgi:hypothetical protein
MKKLNKITLPSTSRKLALCRETIVQLAPARLVAVVAGNDPHKIIQSVLNGCPTFAPGDPNA